MTSPRPIEGHEITFVVQGPVQIFDGRDQPENATELCISSIRKYFPDSTILLSTWREQDLSGLNFDELVENEDQGPLDYGPIRGNINRQIVSTRNGLQNVKTKWAAKIRSDHFFQLDPLFLAQYQEMRGLIKDSGKLKYFEEPICMCFHNVLLRRAHYISDWFHFGLTKDLLNLWSIPLSGDIDASWYKNGLPKSSSFMRPFLLPARGTQRLVPEQHIWISFQKKAGETTCLPTDRNEAFPFKMVVGHYRMARNIVPVSRPDVGLRNWKADAGNMPMDSLVASCQRLMLKGHEAPAAVFYMPMIVKHYFGFFDLKQKILSFPIITFIYQKSGRQFIWRKLKALAPNRH